MFKAFLKSKGIFKYFSKSRNNNTYYFQNKILYHYETTQNSILEKLHKKYAILGLVLLGAGGIVTIAYQYNYSFPLAEDIKSERIRNIPKFKAWLLKHKTDFEKIDFIKKVHIILN